MLEWSPFFYTGMVMAEWPLPVLSPLSDPWTPASCTFSCLLALAEVELHLLVNSHITVAKLLIVAVVVWGAGIMAVVVVVVNFFDHAAELFSQAHGHWCWAVPASVCKEHHWCTDLEKQHGQKWFSLELSVAPVGKRLEGVWGILPRSFNRPVSSWYIWGVLLVFFSSCIFPYRVNFFVRFSNAMSFLHWGLCPVCAVNCKFLIVLASDWVWLGFTTGLTFRSLQKYKVVFFSFEKASDVHENFFRPLNHGWLGLIPGFPSWFVSLPG